MINSKTNPEGKFFAYSTQIQCVIPENTTSLIPTNFLFKNSIFRLTMKDAEYKNVFLSCLGRFKHPRGAVWHWDSLSHLQQLLSALHSLLLAPRV